MERWYLRVGESEQPLGRLFVLGLAQLRRRSQLRESR
jgi:hypothetical protein